MYNFTLRLRTIALGFLFASIAALPSVAQSQMQARDYVKTPTYNTDSPELAVDDSPATAALLSPWLAGGAALRVDFGAKALKNQQAILLVKSSGGGVLTAALLGKMTIRTYLSSGATPTVAVQTLPLDNNNLVNVALLPGSPDVNQVTFAITQNFDQLELQVGGLITTGANIGVYAVYATVAPLPVQLTAFTGKATTTGVALSWTTASEQRNDHFVVERADNAPDDFRALSLVKGTGTTVQSHQYQYVDATAGGLRYYRLRQVDVDGTETFSPVIAVQAEPTALVAYPSIATDVLTIVGAGSTRLGIFDQLGQQVQVADVSAPQVDVRGLPSGVYFLRDAATGQSTRFVKSNER